MPVDWAIAQCDASHMDRFTARCRVPTAVIYGKPRWASGYVLYRPTDASDEAYLCRLAIDSTAVDNDRDDASDTTLFDFEGTVAVSVTAERSLLKRIALHQRETQVAGCREMHWIARRSLRDAVAVTLEVDRDRVDGELKLEYLLANASYRQLLHETLQHNVVVCKSAVVSLPLPGSIGLDASGSHMLPCRVVSTYPDADCVRVTMHTRVTITVPAADRTEIDFKEVPAPLIAEAGKRERVGGLEKELHALREMILLPLQHQALRVQYKIEFPKGVLLCGPPGVGKTLLVRTAVEDCREQVPLHLEIINGSEIMTSGIGEAEQTLRSIFRKAATQAKESDGASVVFIDELDALCPKRDSHGTMAHSRIVAQLLTLLDGADANARENVIIVGATNLPNNIDAALRRPGRFDREIFVSPPDIDARISIFTVHMAELPYLVHGSDQERERFVAALAQRAIGYVGADIAALCREAVSVASARQFVELTRNHELKTWWSDWKRNSRALQVSDLERAVASIAWRVNPVAIPVWFLSKSLLPHSADRPVEFFRYLFQSIRGRTDSSIDSEAVATLGIEDEAGNNEPEVFEVRMEDFEQAMQVVVASSLRSASGVA